MARQTLERDICTTLLFSILHVVAIPTIVWCINYCIAVFTKAGSGGSILEANLEIARTASINWVSFCPLKRMAMGARALG